jgi:hypothetical protein
MIPDGPYGCRAAIFAAILFHGWARFTTILNNQADKREECDQ